MATVNADGNLLFGLLVLQNGLIDQDQLVAAFRARSRDKGRQIPDYLIARGSGSPLPWPPREDPTQRLGYLQHALPARSQPARPEEVRRCRASASLRLRWHEGSRDQDSRPVQTPPRRSGRAGCPALRSLGQEGQGGRVAGQTGGRPNRCRAHTLKPRRRRLLPLGRGDFLPIFDRGRRSVSPDREFQPVANRDVERSIAVVRMTNIFLAEAYKLRYTTRSLTDDAVDRRGA